MRTVRASVERCPSGQREQTVNLPAYAFGGSNPPLSMVKIGKTNRAGIAQLARARAFQARGRGFESRFPAPVDCGEEYWVSLLTLGRSDERNCAILRAENWIRCPGSSVVEHVLGKDEVGGSSPLLGLLLLYT